MIMRETGANVSTSKICSSLAGRLVLPIGAEILSPDSRIY